MKIATGISLGLSLLLVTGCTSLRSILPSGNDNQSSTGNLTRKVAKDAASSSISAVYSSKDCRSISRGGFIWITDEVVLADLLAPLGAASANAVMDKLNFERRGALVVDFGEVPTPNFNVRLMRERLQLDGSKAIVQVDLVKPPANGKRNVQAVTHPCSIYAIPRTGYSTLEVQSELGDVFTSFSN